MRTVLGLTMAAAALVVASVAFADRAHAQFGPPSTVWGAVADSAGQVPAGLAVEAYIDNTLCSLATDPGRTAFTGEGSSRITVYLVQVVSQEQKPGCGKPGATVRIKVGDRFADQTARWEAGLVRLDVSFGSATPPPIPTSTPVPGSTTSGATQAPGGGATTPGSGGQSGSTPAAGTTPAAGGSESPAAGATQGSAQPVAGGLKTNTQATESDDDDSGFAVWAFLGAGVVGLALAGGVIGLIAARRRNALDTIDPDA
jgi:hypothetical protein